jgi:hypothetical protein
MFRIAGGTCARTQRGRDVMPENKVSNRSRPARTVAENSDTTARALRKTQRHYEACALRKLQGAAGRSRPSRTSHRSMLGRGAKRKRVKRVDVRDRRQSFAKETQATIWMPSSARSRFGTSGRGLSAASSIGCGGSPRRGAGVCGHHPGASTRSPRKSARGARAQTLKNVLESVPGTLRSHTVAWWRAPGAPLHGPPVLWPATGGSGSGRLYGFR